MISPQELDGLFLQYLRQPLERWDIVEGALLVAAQEYPDLDRAAYQARVSELSRRMREGIHRRDSKLEILGGLNRFFFGEMGFTGNREHYDDPRNSYLCDVLDRKKGIPISLSVLYLKFAWDAGLPIWGVNFPGHFLVAWKESETEIEKNLYVDVFNGGEILEAAALGEKLSAGGGAGARIEPALHLRTAGVRDILHRMLGNLKFNHAVNQRPGRALWAAQWMRLLKPQDWASLRDQGFYCFALGRLEEAERDLLEYLDKTKKPDDFAGVWKLIYAIRAQNPIRLN